MRFSATVATSIVMLACRDLSPNAVERPGPRDDGAVDVVIHHQALTPSGDSVMLTVSVVGDRASIGSYEGELRFTPQALRVSAIQVPSAGDGEYRVINQSELAQGRIRFAAFATDAFTSSEALRLVARLHGDLHDVALQGTLTLVGTSSGTRLPSAVLHRNHGVRDRATNQLITR